MFIHWKKQKGKFLYTSFKRLIVLSLSCSLIFGPSAGYAQSINFLNLPVPGAMVSPSPVFAPVLLKGMTIHPDDPLKFDFIIDSGNTGFAPHEIKKESEKLVKYFLASMTVPKDDLWVNLSPYEQDRIIPDELGKTELGRDMLAQDYILKQLTASLMYPEEELGQKFWDKVYKKAEEQFGVSEIPVNTFNKVWILPETATVYEHEQTVYVVDTHLKVMLDIDYTARALANNEPLIVDRAPLSEQQTTNNGQQLSEQIIKEIILPEIEREVNEGENFAPLRQIYHSLILAKWYKETIKNSLLSQVYIDQNKIAGVDVEDKTIKDQIYARYIEAYQKGVFNYIREDYDRLSREIIPRKYFSGGITGDVQIQNSSSPVRDSDNTKHLARVEVRPQLRDTVDTLSGRRDAHKKYAVIDMEKKILENLNLQAGDRVLDIGTGAGMFLPMLSRAVAENGSVVGIDINRDILSSAQNMVEEKGLPNVSLARLDLNQGLPFADDSFDAVTSLYMMYYIENVEFVLKEIKRVLKPGGKVIFLGPAHQNNEDVLSIHEAIGGDTALSALARRSAEIMETAVIPAINEHFKNVKADVIENKLIFTDRAAFFEYIQTRHILDFFETEEAKEIYFRKLEEYIDNKFELDGKIVITKFTHEIVVVVEGDTPSNTSGKKEMVRDSSTNGQFNPRRNTASSPISKDQAKRMILRELTRKVPNITNPETWITPWHIEEVMAFDAEGRPFAVKVENLKGQTVFLGHDDPEYRIMKEKGAMKILNEGPALDEVEITRPFFQLRIVRPEDEELDNGPSSRSSSPVLADAKLTLNTINLEKYRGKTAFVRVDFNVPMGEHGVIVDDTRIHESMETLKLLVRRGIKVVLAAHLGDPFKAGLSEAEMSEQLTLKPVHERLVELLKKEGVETNVYFESVGNSKDGDYSAMKPGEVLLLENTRFHKAEKAEVDTDEFIALAQQLYKNIDLFIMEGFGVSHREHVSVVGSKYFDIPRVAGLLMEKEINTLSKVKDGVEVAVMGGAKVSSKIGVLKKLLNNPKTQKIIIGPAIANPFFVARGYSIGSSIGADEAQMKIARELLENPVFDKKAVLPTDALILKSSEKRNYNDQSERPRVVNIGEEIPDGWEIIDIGPQTQKEFSEIIADLRSGEKVFWNGTVGISDIIPKIASDGTRSIGKAMGKSSAFSVVGGGDSGAAIKSFGIEGIDFVSTGGGASLKYIEGGSLFGLEVLTDAVSRSSSPVTDEKVINDFMNLLEPLNQQLKQGVGSLKSGITQERLAQLDDTVKQMKSAFKRIEKVDPTTRDLIRDVLFNPIGGISNFIELGAEPEFERDQMSYLQKFFQIYQEQFDSLKFIIQRGELNNIKLYHEPGNLRNLDQLPGEESSSAPGKSASSPIDWKELSNLVSRAESVLGIEWKSKANPFGGNEEYYRSQARVAGIILNHLDRPELKKFESDAKWDIEYMLRFDSSYDFDVQAIAAGTVLDHPEMFDKEIQRSAESVLGIEWKSEANPFGGNKQHYLSKAHVAGIILDHLDRPKLKELEDDVKWWVGRVLKLGSHYEYDEKAIVAGAVLDHPEMFDKEIQRSAESVLGIEWESEANPFGGNEEYYRSQARVAGIILKHLNRPGLKKFEDGVKWQIERMLKLGSDYHYDEKAIVAGAVLDIASSPVHQSPEYGGIDLNEISVDRQGAGVDIQFDPVAVQEIIHFGVDGFAPVIIHLTPLPSVLPLLGLEPSAREEDFEISSLN